MKIQREFSSDIGEGITDAKTPTNSETENTALFCAQDCVAPDNSFEIAQSLSRKRYSISPR